MKKLRRVKLHSLVSGFTLIELLVVIGILAIMAGALIATLDPFEQIKKGQDSAVKDLSVEFQSSVVRYYGTHGKFPWDTIANGGGGCNGGALPSAPGSNLSALMSCITVLINDGELKSSFANTSNAELTQVFVTNPNGSTNTSVCFTPVSKSQMKDPNTKYSNQGAVIGTCPSGVANACFWCAQ